MYFWSDSFYYPCYIICCRFRYKIMFSLCSLFFSYLFYLNNLPFCRLDAWFLYTAVVFGAVFQWSKSRIFTLGSFMVFFVELFSQNKAMRFSISGITSSLVIEPCNYIYTTSVVALFKVVYLAFDWINPHCLFGTFLTQSSLIKVEHELRIATLNSISLMKF